MTAASDVAPTRRAVRTLDGDFVVEVGAVQVTMRPKWARRGGPAEIRVPWQSIYFRAMRDRADAAASERAQRRRGRRRR